jgi:hypothetical protein
MIYEVELLFIGKLLVRVEAEHQLDACDIAKDAFDDGKLDEPKLILHNYGEITPTNDNSGRVYRRRPERSEPEKP